MCPPRPSRPRRTSTATASAGRSSATPPSSPVRSWPGWCSSSPAGSRTERRTHVTGPLDGVLVVDLTRALAGPHAAMMLGDLGARVIKVENPGSGDDTPGWGPPFVQPDGADRESTYFLSTNRNKESITLDLKDAGDKTVLTDLLRRADVLLENFRPGTLARLGFGTDVLAELNPRLVTPAINGFGHHGPEGGRAGHHPNPPGDRRGRARGAGGRPRRLRPDRPGRGRPHVGDRPGAGRPAAGRRPDRR